MSDAKRDEGPPDRSTCVRTSRKGGCCCTKIAQSVVDGTDSLEPRTMSFIIMTIYGRVGRLIARKLATLTLSSNG